LIQGNTKITIKPLADAIILVRFYLEDKYESQSINLEEFALNFYKFANKGATPTQKTIKEVSLTNNKVIQESVPSPVII